MQTDSAMGERLLEAAHCRKRAKESDLVKESREGGWSMRHMGTGGGAKVFEARQEKKHNVFTHLLLPELFDYSCW